MQSDAAVRSDAVPRMRNTARRLLSGCRDGSIDIDDLIQEARIAIYLRRDQIIASPDPVASCYIASKQAMIDAVRRANRMDRRRRSSRKDAQPAEPN